MSVVISDQIIFNYFVSCPIPGLNQAAKRLLDLVQQVANTETNRWVVLSQSLERVRNCAVELGIVLDIEMISHLEERGIEILDGAEAYARAFGGTWGEGDAHYAAINNASILLLLSGSYQEVVQEVERQHGITLSILSRADLESLLTSDSSSSENIENNSETVFEDTETANEDSVEESASEINNNDSLPISQPTLTKFNFDPIAILNNLIPWLLAPLFPFLPFGFNDLSSEKADSAEANSDLSSNATQPDGLNPIGSDETDPDDPPAGAPVKRPNPPHDGSGGSLAAEPSDSQPPIDQGADSNLQDDGLSARSSADSIEIFDVVLEFDRSRNATVASDASRPVELISNSPSVLPSEDFVAVSFENWTGDVETPGIERPDTEPIPKPTSGNEDPSEPTQPGSPGKGSDSDAGAQPNQPGQPGATPIPVEEPNDPLSGGTPSEPVQPSSPDGSTDPIGEAPNNEPPTPPIPGDHPTEPPTPPNPSDPGEDPDPGTGSIQPRVIDTLGGNHVVDISPEDGQVVLVNFGGVGKGTAPSQSIIAEVDTLKFTGAAFIPQNMLLTQTGEDLIIRFEGIVKTEVVLQDFQLENLDNLLRPDASADLANISFDGQVQLQDNFDVFNADWNLKQVFNPGTTTFLNDLDNWITGFEQSNDVINGQGGRDTLLGLSGDDILRGGFGDDTLIGGAGENTLVGNEGADIFVLSRHGLIQVNDFTPGQDFIGLPSDISVDQLQIQQGTGVYSGDTLISLDHQVLARLKGVQANAVTVDRFVQSSSEDWTR